MPKTKEKLTLLVLAGGYSERFNGKKAFFKAQNKPLIKHVIENTSTITNETIISCRTEQKKLHEMFPKTKIIKDKPPKDGPLAGLKSSLPSVKSEYIALVSCDCPKIKPEVLKLLYKKAKGHSAAVPRWPKGYLEPLVAVYRTSELRESVNKTWRNGEMKLSKVVEKLSDVIFVSTGEIKSVDPDLESFVNLNTPEEVKSEF